MSKRLHIIKKIRYKLYRIKYNLAKYVHFKSPVHVDIELNTNCNQKCISCWHSQKIKPFRIGNMKYHDVCDILNKAKDSGALSVKLNLRGEPTLYPKLIDVIKYASGLGFIDIMINTNGTNLTENLIDELNKSGLTTVIISADSFNEKTYCKMHGCSKSDFENMYYSLSYLRMLHNFKILKLNVIVNIHRNIHNESENKLLKIIMSEYDCFTFVIRDTEKRHGTDISIKKEKRKRKKLCPHMMTRLTVTQNSKVYPCCVCYDEPTDIMLNMSGKTLKSIWNGKEIKLLINNYKKGIYTETCKNCTSGDIWK